jgi:hypothetical protein
VGSQVGAQLYGAYGWTAMCAGAAGFLAVAALLMLRTHLRTRAARSDAGARDTRA